MIVTVNFYHHHLSQHEDYFKSRILSSSVRTVRRNYLVVVVLSASTSPRSTLQVFSIFDVFVLDFVVVVVVDATKNKK